MYKWGYALEKLQFTDLDLQICNCKVAMLAFSGYKVPTLHLQNTKLHSSNFGLQVWNDITHMYIYGTTNHKYWFTNLQLHGCNVRILTPLAFHRVHPLRFLNFSSTNFLRTKSWIFPGISIKNWKNIDCQFPVWVDRHCECVPMGKKNKVRFYRDLNSDRWIQSPEC